MIWLGAGVLIALQVHLMGAHVITSNERFPEREVMLAFVVNRHGERSPDADELSFSDQQEKIKNITYIEGLEGLTNVGKRRAYELGKFIRERYGSKGFGLLSDIYFQDQIALRSTDKERTKMTAQMAMAAVYPPVVEQQWNEDLGKVWQPVPYTAVPLTEDYLRYYSNCQRFKDLIAAAKKESVYQEFAQYRDLIAVIKKQTGRDFSQDPSLFQTLFDLYKSQVSLGLEIPTWVKPLMPRLGEAAKLAYRLYFRNDEMKRIGGGVILNDFVNAANDIAAGKPVTKRFRMFSSHDFNIGALMEVTKVVRQEQGIPEYGALFGLELYRAKGTGEFSVVPVYLPKAGDSKVQELHFSGCDARKQCDLKRFVESTKQYLLPEKEFYEICKIRTELP